MNETYSNIFQKYFWFFNVWLSVYRNVYYINIVVVFDSLGKWYQYWEKISIEIRSYFYNQEDNMINLKSLMNVFGKRSYLQGIFTYNILLKRAFLRKFSDRDENFLIFPCVAKPWVYSIFPIPSSTSLPPPLKCIYWFFIV